MCLVATSTDDATNTRSLGSKRCWLKSTPISQSDPSRSEPRAPVGAFQAIMFPICNNLSRPLTMAKQSKPKKRVRDPVLTRAKLLQATIELVTEKGAAALSLKEAARRAKVSRGVAYLHFDDREQLLHEAQ